MEQSEFLRCAEQYKDMIYRIALNCFRNPEDADDMVQDVLLKLYIAGDDYNGDEHIKRWLIRVTLNLCKNALRSRGRRREVSIEELTMSVPFYKEEQNELFTTVMSLPPKYRAVLYLFYYEDLSVREIADVTESTESAVTTRLSRARNLLKNEYMEALQDG